MQAPKLLLFDFGNVIANFDNTWFVQHLVPDSVIPHKELVRRIFQETRISREFETGKISFKRFKEGVEKVLEKRFSTDVFQNAFCDIFKFIPETFELISRLKGKVRFGMLSNTNEIHCERVIKKIPAIDVFGQLTFSHEVGAMKPSLEIYADVLRKWDGKPDEILYLDDIPEFVAAGKQAGMNAWVFHNPSEITRQIQNLFK